MVQMVSSLLLVRLLFFRSYLLLLRKEADIELGGGSFLIHRHYKDDIMTRLLNSAAKILELKYDELVERYGEHFFKHCLECGYERLLRVLGRNLYDFLCNLDALHDHLTSIYPGMRAPSFRCYLGDDGSMTLRYYSDRKGLERMVSGIIKAVAREFFDTKVSVTLTSRKGKRQDHTVFHVKEDNFTTILVRKRSSSLVSVLHRAKSSTNPKDLPLSVVTFCKAFPFHMIIDRHFQIVQAGSALCRVLRTYRKKTKKLMFDKVFQVVRPVLNSLNFETLHDHINTVVITVTKPGVIDSAKVSPTEASGGGGSSGGCRNSRSSTSSSGSNSRTSTGGVEQASSSSSPSTQVLRLKGQMVFIPETDTLLYLCSPRVTDVDELRERGLYLSDIPIHDATRDLILITQARRAERELVETLEETSNNLKKLQCKLREDKGRTDELLNSLLPSAIAERLRLNQAVEAEKYNLVTILFSDIVGFTAMCGNEKVVPMDIVRLLNKLYTHFDMLSNIHDVYKAIQRLPSGLLPLLLEADGPGGPRCSALELPYGGRYGHPTLQYGEVETIGDAYMVVGGMPEFTESHADKVTSMAFDMLERSGTVLSPVQSSPIAVRIGIHSGPCVAGVVGQKMPRYCLFGQTVAIASNMENSSMPGKVNISHVARGYLSNQALYEFEENTTRGDLPTECSFIRPKHNAPRPVSMDLGVPLPRGMFRTPNPSPTNSRGASPVDGASPNSSPIRLNSPEGTMPKFKMPAIHICDADEEDFRSNLQAKINQVAVSMATETSGEPSETFAYPDASPSVPEDPENSASTMSFREYLFSDAQGSAAVTSTTATTTVSAATTSSPPATQPKAKAAVPSEATKQMASTLGKALYDAAAGRTDDVDVGVRRHSHQPTSSCDAAGALDVQLLNKSVTMSDMTDPQAAHIMVISLDSPSSAGSVSEVSDSSAASRRPSQATTCGSPPSPCWQGSPPEERGISRWCVPCGSASSSAESDKESSAVVYRNHHAANGTDRNCDSPLLGRVASGSGLSAPCGVISRRRSEPGKHVDLSDIVDLPQTDRGGEGSTPKGSRSPVPQSSPRSATTAVTGTHAKGSSKSACGSSRSNEAVKTEMTLSGQRVESDRAADRRRGRSEHDRTAHHKTQQEGVSSSSSKGAAQPSNTNSTASSSGEDRLQAPNGGGDHPGGGGGGGQRSARERLSKADLKRIRENGRLVIYFKGRPRCMSPSLRLHPLTVPEGSRSLHDSPFSSPMLTQKLKCLQGDSTKQVGGDQDTFFSHVRLKRRDLNL